MGNCEDNSGSNNEEPSIANVVDDDSKRNTEYSRDDIGDRYGCSSRSLREAKTFLE